MVLLLFTISRPILLFILCLYFLIRIKAKSIQYRARKHSCLFFWRKIINYICLHLYVGCSSIHVRKRINEEKKINARKCLIKNRKIIKSGDRLSLSELKSGKVFFILRWNDNTNKIALANCSSSQQEIYIQSSSS